MSDLQPAKHPLPHVHPPGPTHKNRLQSDTCKHITTTRIHALTLYVHAFCVHVTRTHTDAHFTSHFSHPLSHYLQSLMCSIAPLCSGFVWLYLPIWVTLSNTLDWRGTSVSSRGAQLFTYIQRYIGATPLMHHKHELFGKRSTRPLQQRCQGDSNGFSLMWFYTLDIFEVSITTTNPVEVLSIMLFQALSRKLSLLLWIIHVSIGCFSWNDFPQNNKSNWKSDCEVCWQECTIHYPQWRRRRFWNKTEGLHRSEPPSSHNFQSLDTLLI